MKGLVAADLTQLIAFTGFFSMFFYATLYMQEILRYSPLKAGAAYLPITAGFAVAGGMASQLVTRIGTRPVPDVIKHTEWLEKDFIATVQKRGAAIIEARGLSSAASAANAVVDTVRKLTTPTPTGDWFSVAVCSDGSYGIDKDIMFSYPIRTDGKKWEIVQGVPLNEFSREKINLSIAELKAEKADVSELLPK